MSQPPISPDSDDRRWIDYSRDLRITRNPLLRRVYAALGLLSVALGVVGVFLPGWPTTVWVLIATFFFARSSPRFYNWVLNHRLFGPLVRDFRAGLGVPLWVKVLAIGMIILFAGSSALILIDTLWVRLLVAALGLIGAGYLLSLPTRPLPPSPRGLPPRQKIQMVAATVLVAAILGVSTRPSFAVQLLIAVSALVIVSRVLQVPDRNPG